MTAANVNRGGHGAGMRCVCERCGREITWARCPECGNEHEDGAVPPVTVCPVCGVEMQPLCARCAYSLEEGGA